MTVIERDILSLSDWFSQGLPIFAGVLLLLILAGAFFGYLSAALRHGPGVAIGLTFGTIGVGIRELFEISPRRVWAMSVLAFREALRRRVLVVFAVFMVLMLFAGWYLDPGAEHPAVVYISFIFGSINFLILLLAVFLSTFSLPDDVKTKTIYTIVTKPVRAWEIVLGRIFGFAAMGTLLLMVMGIFGYVFVVRGLNHSHTLDPVTRQEKTVESGSDTLTISEYQTSRVNRHRHLVTIGPDGATIEANKDHVHAVQVDDDGEVMLGSNEGDLQSRVPLYGTLSFWGRDGKPADKGVNVGNEWGYRSYIEGSTLATAIYSFEGLKPRDFPDGIPVEMLIRVFRTHKGDIDRGIFGTIQVVEPAETDPGVPPKPLEQRKRFEVIPFTARENTVDQHLIPFKATGFLADGSPKQDMLLFDDLVRDGKLEIWIRCGEKGQYFGVARRDLYIRQADADFWANFAKGFLGIWFQMVIATCFAVMFSTFLTGPVAMLASLAAMLMGWQSKFVTGIFRGLNNPSGSSDEIVEGGGPIEAMVRMFTQRNLTLPLEPGVTTDALKAVDYVAAMLMAGIASILPDFGMFNTAVFVSAGTDIGADLLTQHTIITLIYVVTLTSAGYFFLKTREIAA